jgi:hypothetical protein
VHSGSLVVGCFLKILAETISLQRFWNQYMVDTLEWTIIHSSFTVPELISKYVSVGIEVSSLKYLISISQSPTLSYVSRTSSFSVPSVHWHGFLTLVDFSLVGHSSSVWSGQRGRDHHLLWLLSKSRC